ncbi:hypothetical protein PYW07_010419 [Mythimna separata]|uniref:Uncharacterized protein n=1 Tax=Mythimna separata TaxID=271217 RepID=A0AAD7YA95_MYTSE|nr:hypothetical protein PYW07_010419 [Mythimna separata]
MSALPCNATEMIPARQNPPKDGYGPRGYPDCYYTSRVLDSTARYVKFVRKLRALEEEQRKGTANTLKELHDKQNNDFFIRCDRRSLINNVARRVDLCLASYQEDLKVKRQKLLVLLTNEEEANIRKFVEQAQAGAAALWQDKKDRLAFLLDKRQKEHEDKYKDPPISKFVHVSPCIVALRAREAQETQLYQMKEKQARWMAERELDRMWHEVVLKESEALTQLYQMKEKQARWMAERELDRMWHEVVLKESEALTQLYQMKEKQARWMAERELDRMWHEVVLKESEALTQLYQMKEKQARWMAERELDRMWHEVVLKESEALVRSGLSRTSVICVAIGTVLTVTSLTDLDTTVPDEREASALDGGAGARQDVARSGSQGV